MDGAALNLRPIDWVLHLPKASQGSQQSVQSMPPALNPLFPPGSLSSTLSTASSGLLFRALSAGLSGVSQSSRSAADCPAATARDHCCSKSASSDRSRSSSNSSSGIKRSLRKSTISCSRLRSRSCKVKSRKRAVLLPRPQQNSKQDAYQELAELKRQKQILEEKYQNESMARKQTEEAAARKDETIRQLQRSLETSNWERDQLLQKMWQSQEGSPDKDRHIADLQRQLEKTQLQLKQAQTYNRTGRICDFIIEFAFMGKWYDFSAEAASAACSAWLAGESMVEVQSGGQAYTLDFNKMVQVNKRTGKERKIRILPSLPQHWTLKAEHVLDNVYSTGEAFPRECWEHVAHDWTNSHWIAFFSELLSASVHHHHQWNDGPTSCDHFKTAAKVTKVWHIENPMLLQEYVSTARKIAAERSGDGAGLQAMEVIPKLKELQSTLALGAVPSEAQERFLFHGAPWKKIQSIVLEGLDNRCADRATYGYGAYFASQACKCWQYCCPKQTGQQVGYIVVARVALGEPFWATYVPKNRKEQFKKPPPRFDSVLAQPGKMPGHPRGGFQHHCEYIVFEKSQVYPEFVLEVEGTAFAKT